MLNFLTKLINRLRHKQPKKPICQRCKKEIPEPTYIFISCSIIINVAIGQYKIPPLFSCPEHAWNFAQGIILHTNCWIDMLREYGTSLYDMDKVCQEYNKKQIKKS